MQHGFVPSRRLFARPTKGEKARKVFSKLTKASGGEGRFLLDSKEDASVA